MKNGVIYFNKEGKEITAGNTSAAENYIACVEAILKLDPLEDDNKVRSEFLKNINNIKNINNGFAELEKLLKKPGIYHSLMTYKGIDLRHFICVCGVGADLFGIQKVKLESGVEYEGFEDFKEKLSKRKIESTLISAGLDSSSLTSTTQVTTAVVETNAKPNAGALIPATTAAAATAADAPTSRQVAQNSERYKAIVLHTIPNWKPRTAKPACWDMHSLEVLNEAEGAGFTHHAMMIKKDRCVCDTCGVEVSGIRPWTSFWALHNYAKHDSNFGPEFAMAAARRLLVVESMTKVILLECKDKENLGDGAAIWKVVNGYLENNHVDLDLDAAAPADILKQYKEKYIPKANDDEPKIQLCLNNYVNNYRISIQSKSSDGMISIDCPDHKNRLIEAMLININSFLMRNLSKSLLGHYSSLIYKISIAPVFMTARVIATIESMVEGFLNTTNKIFGLQNIWPLIKEYLNFDDVELNNVEINLKSYIMEYTSNETMQTITTIIDSPKAIQNLISTNILESNSADFFIQCFASIYAERFAKRKEEESSERKALEPLNNSEQSLVDNGSATTAAVPLNFQYKSNDSDSKIRHEADRTAVRLQSAMK